MDGGREDAMPTLNTAVRPRGSVVKATITRADGTVEDLGLIAFWHRNRLVNFLGQSLIRLRGARRGRSRSEHR